MDAANYSSRTTGPNPNNILVGLSQDSYQLKDRLTSPQQTKLEIIPIVGMGGIGKTTLARYVYDDSLVVYHFDRRAWVTVSQDYNVRVILLDLIGCVIGELSDEMLKMKNDELSLFLYQNLKGRRYLIVVDDIWDDNAWDDVKRLFPEDNNGSRVMVTTRESSVATYAAGGSNSSNHKMHLLNKDLSWNLLHQKVFASQGKNCPAKIGEKIANNCGGLPLAIQVMSGLLSSGQVERTPKSWEQVAQNVSPSRVATPSGDEQVSKILSLSYNHLPSHLKPCFLYFAAFPEDFEVQHSNLIMLLIAEGFVEPVSDHKSLEEAADMLLKALVDRHLIFVSEQDIDGSVESYRMHDVLRDLCVRKAREENFLYVMNKKQVQVHTSSSSFLCRVSVHQSYRIGDIYESERLMKKHTNSFLCIGTASRLILSDVIFGMLFLRVLGIEFYEFPKELLQLINLRYLAVSCRSPFPSSISTLCNLETIVFRSLSKLWVFEPSNEIFDLSRLRCIRFRNTFPCFSLADGKSYGGVQENLQSLSSIVVNKSFISLIKSVPNLKELGIFGYYSLSYNIDLTSLCKLETLKCSSDLSPDVGSLLSCIIFPPSIKKLILYECAIPVVCMNKIGCSLPNLEVLKLEKCIMIESTWEPIEGEFPRLQFLLLEKLNMVEWIADDTHFPILKRLVIRDCSQLEDIPSGIGYICTLETIEVYGPCPSVVDSARKIHEEQLDYGHEIRISVA